MNINILEPKQFRKSLGHCRLFSEITKKKKVVEQKQQKMICTKDTLKQTIQNEQQQKSYNLSQFDYHFQNKIKQFKMSKAQQIADIAIDGDIPVKNIIKRIRSKLQKQLFDYILQTIKDMNMYEAGSAQKASRSPKQLGSTIEHTYTPRSIQTPAFDFDSSGQNKINQFSVGSNEFTLGNQKQIQGDNIKGSKQQKVVSEFNVGLRNPTSKRIKDKIMNSKRSQIY